MARKADPQRLETLQTTIQTHPGQKPSFFARILGWPIEVVVRVLTSLNDREIGRAHV